MNLVGIMPVRNEAWCLGLSLRVALQWCDSVVILLHECSDESETMVYELQDQCDFMGRIQNLSANGDWREMEHRQRMMSWAWECDATHIALIDADEVLTHNRLATIRDDVERLAPGEMLQVGLWNLRGGIDRYHSSGLWANRWVSLAFPVHPNACWRGDTFHHREPHGVNWKLRPQNPGGVLHLWGASEERLRAKHALYKLTERLRWPGKDVRKIDREYSQWRDCGMDTAPCKPEWWAGYEDLMQYLDLSAVPWQIAECRRIVAEHPGITRGLDLFGVV